MYLRETHRRNADGSVVSYLALAHNERDPRTGTPKAKVIHNFGRADQVDREALGWLALLLLRVGELGCRDTWRNLRDELDRLHLVVLRTAEGTIAQRSELTARHKEILRRLHLPEPPRQASHRRRSPKTSVHAPASAK